MKIARAKEMQKLDRTAMENYHVPGIVLMENAGRGTVEYMLRELGPVAGRSAVIFVGPGNNGGDGLVIARRIHQLGGLPFIIYLVDPQKLGGDAGINYNSVREINLPSVTFLDAGKLDTFSLNDLDTGHGNPPWAIVDAVFGTGLKRPLTDHFSAAVNCMNRLRKTHGCPVVAVDIPSGYNADTGGVHGVGVQSDHTVTYGLAKPGHFIHGAARFGKLHIVDIGIPAAAVDQAVLMGEVVSPEILNILGNRPHQSHKGSYGHTLILAGSAGKTGAAILSGLGALRSGTGLVTLAVPADLRTVFDSSLFEAMTLLLANSRRYPSIKDHTLLTGNLEGKTAVVMGPGIGTREKTQELIKRLYCEHDLPMVVDADALNILAMEPELLTDPPAPRILTPHPGEMGRLTNLESKKIQADRLSAALEFTASVNKNNANVTTVLKGAGTIIVDPEGTWAINPTGNPGMAAGGMGDVLSGIIGGLLAQGIAPAQAARAGAYVHGLAADKLAKKRYFGYLASEVADIVPNIITQHLKQ